MSTQDSFARRGGNWNSRRCGVRKRWVREGGVSGPTRDAPIDGEDEQVYSFRCVLDCSNKSLSCLATFISASIWHGNDRKQPNVNRHGSPYAFVFRANRLILPSTSSNPALFLPGRVDQTRFQAPLKVRQSYFVRHVPSTGALRGWELRQARAGRGAPRSGIVLFLLSSEREYSLS